MKTLFRYLLPACCLLACLLVVMPVAAQRDFLTADEIEQITNLDLGAWCNA